MGPRCNKSIGWLVTDLSWNYRRSYDFTGGGGGRGYSASPRSYEIILTSDISMEGQ